MYVGYCDILFNRSLISAQGYAPACHCDGLVEVVGLQGVMHLVRVAKVFIAQEQFIEFFVTLTASLHLGTTLTYFMSLLEDFPTLSAAYKQLLNFFKDI